MNMFQLWKLERSKEMTKLSVQEAAEMLGLDRRTVKALISNKEFGKAIQNGKKTVYLIYKEQLIKWLGLAG